MNSPLSRNTTGSLTQFAYLIGGPIDFVVNGIINAMVAQIVFNCVQEVPLTGPHSALMVTGPMLFIMPCLTTLFGYQGGVMQRRLGDFGPPWVAGTPWLKPALRTGMIRSLAGGITGCAVLLLLGQLAGPEYTLDRVNFVWLNGLLAAILGYLLHSRAIILSGRL